MLTRAGLAVAVTSVAMVVCGWWWRYAELIVGGVAAMTAVLVSLVGARSDPRVSIVRTVDSPRVARGEPVRATYRVTNTARRRSAPFTVVDVITLAGRDDATGWTTHARLPVPAIGRAERSKVRGDLVTRRRGVHTLGPWQLEREDPFGFAIGRRTATSTPTSPVTSTIIVHPRVHQLSGPYGPMHATHDEALLRRAASDPLSGFVSLREYVPGDDPRLIHWPTTARMGTLMLREHVELRRPEFTVVVDAARASGTADDFEEVVDVAASVAVHAIRSGVDVIVRTTSRHQPGAPGHLSRDIDVLDVLTPLTPVGDDAATSLPELFHSGFDHSSIIVITGPAGPSSTFGGRVTGATVVRVGAGAVIGPGVTLAVDDAVEFAHRWRP